MLPQVKEISRQYLDAGKRLHSDLIAGRMTMDEFDKELAYFSIQCGFDELAFEPYPPRPSELREYDNASDEQRRILLEKPAFWNIDEIKIYLSLYEKTLSKNLGHLWWLKELLERFIKCNDDKRILMVKAKIATYPNQTI